jgi:hypothetical protein
MMAMMVAFAAPAMADDLDFDGLDDGFFVIVDCDDDGFFDNCNNNDRFCDDDFFFDDCNNNNDRFDDGFFFGGGDGFGDFEQEAESGDIDQSFDVSGTGDNSNQTVGIQGVANTGNAQNQIGVVDAGGFGDFDANDDERFFFVDDNNNEDGFFFFGDDLNNDRFFGDNDGDFEFEDVGSTIEVSPTNTTSSDQQVNQTATSFGK